MCKAISSTLIVVINIPFIVISLILVAVGAMVKWKHDMIADRIAPAMLDPNADAELKDAARQLIGDVIQLLSPFGLAVFIFGIFLFVLTFCGIFGVCCRSKVLLGTYAALLLVMFFALLIVTIVFGTRSAWFRKKFQDALRDIIVESYQMDNDRQPEDKMTALIDSVQRDQRCCGSYGSYDYRENESFKRQRYQIPASCCVDPKDTNCWHAPTPYNSYKDIGCSDSLWEVIDPHLKIILYVLIGLLVFTFLFAVISIYLLTRYTREELVTV